MFNINVDLSALMQVREEMEPDYRALQQKLVDSAEYVRNTWISAVQGTKLPGMTRTVNNDQYKDALNTGQSLQFPQMFHAVVMPYNFAEGAESVEKGAPSFDMKTEGELVDGKRRGNLLSGPRARVSKKGTTYNIIPFRHVTPTSSEAFGVRMPKTIFNRAKRMTQSIPNAATGKVNWAQRLQDYTPVQTNSMSGYTHKTSVYQGMFRVGNPGHTNYLTFRTVSTKSPKNSWIHPATPPNPLIQSVYNKCMPKIDNDFKELIEKMYSN